MRRRDLMDTTPEARRRYVELLRKLTPAQKFMHAIELSDQARQMKELQRNRDDAATQSEPDTHQR